MKRLGYLLLLFTAAAQVISAQESLEPTLKSLQSRLQSMSEGYYTDAEWNDLFSDMKILGIRAEAREDVPLQLQTILMRGLAYADILKDNQQAIELYEDALARFGQESNPLVKRLYVRLADVYSREGDGASVERIKARFKSSPVYDLKTYEAWGGSSPSEPVKVVRSSGQEEASSTLTAIEKLQAQAELAPGAPFPPFEAETRRGEMFRMEDLGGKVVLVDFWVQGWKPWLRDLPNRQYLYETYRKDGLEIIGICLDPDTDAAQKFARKSNMDWPQVFGNPHLPRKYRVFGEATSFLVNRQGIIAAKNLSGAELVQAVKQALQQ